ncbi:hydrogenase maturation protein [Paramagnetospirillum magneticum]|uniref:Probable sensor protein hoxX n=1 Tax=Paramagnetospirillum magneticum (strain ATCC 700264 / AMB-1) TaxID=342108 RepID=Q2W6T6_PARM1|nr:hydrogenase maturation protein [Paramagnetospirillum magneticum]BAE50439.1 Probable sensor protein hoxX [Paramagnetospirillum magneticum AMB-1]
MHVLLLAHSFNSLTQRLWVELSELGHDVTCEFDVNDAVTLQAVELARPDVIVAPFLKRAIPEAVWKNHLCLVVHPGPPGDRGPAALDWAILEGHTDWGVTVLQAEEGMDEGPVWASRTFPLRHATKSSLYRNEVADGAVEAVLDALARLGDGPVGRPALAPFRPSPRQADRAIDWTHDDTATVLAKIRSADGTPGLLDSILDRSVYLHDAHAASGLSGKPGELVARSGRAVARATTDGAVWIGHLRAREEHGLKLPALDVLGPQDHLPEAPGYHDIWYDERHGVGYLHFPFVNGAMSTDQCRRLRAAFVKAAQRPTKVIALMGGPDFWSNGIHLCTIESAASPAEESWANINAMNDLTREIITCGSHLTVAAMQGNAGAGGVFMALAADLVAAREAVVLNPHYKGMGNLYGSEYWTYLLPRRCGPDKARQVVEARLPMGTAEAERLGLIDCRFGRDVPEFRRLVEEMAEALTTDPALDERLAAKRLSRAADEAAKPLEQYRAEELEHMKLNFYGFDPSYHVARYNFIHKVKKSRTPLYLAVHRSKINNIR